MNSLSILESIYSGEPYPVAEKVMVDPSEVNLSFKYNFMRFPNKNKATVKLEQKPYKIDFEKYKEVLKRTSLRVGEWSPLELDLYSKPDEYEQFIVMYDDARTSLREPLKISDLMYDSKSLSPLGIMALLFRKCYGNEEFRRFINSTLLKEYRKEKVMDLGMSKTLYVREDVKERLSMVFNLEKQFDPYNWEYVKDILVQSPYIFIWRD